MPRDCQWTAPHILRPLWTDTNLCTPSSATRTLPLLHFFSRDTYRLMTPEGSVSYERSNLRPSQPFFASSPPHPGIAARNLPALLLVPTLAPRLECARLPVLLSMLDRWRRPWRRSLSRHRFVLCLAPHCSCATETTSRRRTLTWSTCSPTYLGLIHTCTRFVISIIIAKVVAQSLGSMMPMPSPEATNIHNLNSHSRRCSRLMTHLILNFPQLLQSSPMPSDLRA